MLADLIQTVKLKPRYKYCGPKVHIISSPASSG